MEENIGLLDAPIIRVAGDDTSIPAGRINETMVVPNSKDVYEAVKKIV